MFQCFTRFSSICSVLLLIIMLSDIMYAQTEIGLYPVIIEAESGDQGGNFESGQIEGATYVTVINNSTAMNPGDASNIITYQVTFQDSGVYDFYVRLWVGPNGFDDDSFFYGNGFGEKDPTTDEDWHFVNGLGSGGFADSSSVIDGPGPFGVEVWKWVNLTKNGYQGSPGDPFTTSLDSLTNTFQIGGREDGLYIDKIAFGKSNLFFTVGALDNELPGSLTNPNDDTTGVVWEGPQLAIGQSKFIGCGYDAVDPDFALYWNQLTPGNAGKFGSVATSSDTSQWNWTNLDEAYNYAIKNNLLFKNHCLIWGQQQPDWLTNSGLSYTEQAQIVEDWIRMVGERYPETYMIDVVNEPLLNHNPAPYREALGGAGSTGWDWVIWSFEKARQYMPYAKLLLNDYYIIHDNSATTTYLEIINLLKDRGLIDGIGIQGHRSELESRDTSVLRYNLDRLAATGLPIYITEFDLGNLGNEGTPDDEEQLQLYQKIFPLLWEHPGIKGITFWGYREGQMWMSTCYLVRYTGTARPAFLWLVEYLQNNPTGIKETEFVSPVRPVLHQNFPNPFNTITNISFTIPSDLQVKLKIFDMMGKEVTTIVNEDLPAGEHSIQWEAKDLSPGVYFYTLEAGSIKELKKFILLK